MILVALDGSWKRDLIVAATMWRVCVWCKISGLGIILWFGTLMYAWIESMKIVDALYFTVVTASTVGFGDCKPTLTFACSSSSCS